MTVIYWTRVAFGELLFRIAEESNTASHDHFPITATCASNIKSKEGTEAWHLHCDLNGDGKVDEGKH